MLASSSRLSRINCRGNMDRMQEGKSSCLILRNKGIFLGAFVIIGIQKAKRKVFASRPRGLQISAIKYMFPPSSLRLLRERILRSKIEDS